MTKRFNSMRHAQSAEPGRTAQSHASSVSMRERDVMKVILDYCAVQRIFVERRNVGGLKDSAGNFVKFNRKGMADLWGIIKGTHWECEIKRPGQEPNREQIIWLIRCADAGARAIWADSLEMFIEGMRGLI